MGEIFLEITIVIGIAAFLAIIFRIFRQPAILAYVLTGIILGPVGVFHLQNQEVLKTMGEFGITLLLFLLGLELKLSELRAVGKVALLTGIGQIVFTALIGFAISMLLGFSTVASLYIAIALTFSSTIIIVKLLSDKKDLTSLYGKISVGFLLVQDFFAIIALILLSGFNTSGGESISLLSFGIVLLKAVALFALVIYLSKVFFPNVINKIARSPETLFLFSIAWAFGLSALVSAPFIGFSIEIGGFLAGLALANSSENFHIVTKVRPLRDFFVTLFFIMLGTSMVFTHLSAIWIPVVLFSLFILIGNPLIVMAILGAMGYKKKTSFMAGLTVAQISEFSLIVVFLGNRLGHVPNEVVSIVTVVGVITFTASTYMILNNTKLYRVLQPYLGIFQKRKAKETPIATQEFKDHVVLIGANKTGQSILDTLQHHDEPVIVIDLNPDVIKKLEEKGIISIFGDMTDTDVHEKVHMHSAKLIISTASNFDDNSMLIAQIRKVNKDAKIIMLAYDKDEVHALYQAGADYVVLPHLAGGRHVAHIIKEKNIEKIEEFKQKDLPYLF